MLLKAYRVVTPFNHGQTHLVIAESMAKAEELTKREYGEIKIERIEHIADYVIVQKKD